jgi:hypothetical protein
MTELICLGGPWHGRFVEPDDRMTISAPMSTRSTVRGYSDAAEPDSLPMPRKVTYHRGRILVRGWRFPLNCLTNWTVESGAPDGTVLPGYVHGVPGECEPDRNAAPAGCRCAQINVEQALRRVLHGPSTARPSACYLDYCPTHGPFRERD